MDKIEGSLEVGRNEAHEVVINLDAETVAGFDATGGHIVFSSRQARALANLLVKHAAYADAERQGRKSPNEGCRDLTTALENRNREKTALERRIAALTEHRGILLNAASIARHMDANGLAESSGIRPIVSALELQLGAIAADDAQAEGEKL